MSEEQTVVEGQTNTETPSTTEGTQTPNTTEAPEGTQERTTLLTEGSKTESEEGKISTEGQKKQEVEKAPEEYSDFALPEGMQLSKDMLGTFTKTAKELNLTQENAQKMIDVAVAHTKALEKQAMDYQDKVRQYWHKSLREDQEFGGDNFDQTIENAKRVLGKYGSKELTDFLVKSGTGDNNEVIKLLARIGHSMGEDSTVDGSTAPEPKSAADIIYGNNN